MIDENFVLVDATEKHFLYYNTETQVLSISNGLKSYGVNIDKLGDEIFREGDKDVKRQHGKEYKNPQ